MGAANKLYNGNIAETFWSTATDGGFVRNYGYKYDSLNRLKDATYQKSNSVTHNYDENLTYDKNGNIVTLLRYTHNSDGQIGAMKMDELAYDYKSPTSNQLMKVTESLSGNVSQGFIDGNTTGDDYVYDANGNMIVDNNKHITSITYNHLNLPTQITFGTTGNIVYIYTASGQKVKKVVTSTTPASVVTTDYLGGYQYSNSSLQFFPTAEGYVKNTPVSGTNTYSYVFNYTDHLGNVRLSYTKNPSTNALTILEESNYYPFGLKHNGYNIDNFQPEYKYQYNGKEMQDELQLNLYDFGARKYDPALGRWINIDPLAETSRRFSPYTYALNNPVYFIDPDGMKQTPNRGSNIDDDFNKGEIKDSTELFPVRNDTENGRYGKDDPNNPSSDEYVDNLNYVPNYIAGDGKKDSKNKDDKGKDNKKDEDSSTASSILVGGAVLTAETSEVPPVAVAVAIGTTVVVGVIKLYEGVNTVFQYAADFKKNFAKSKEGYGDEAEHTKGARRSTRTKHEEGQARKGRDKGGEKGDKRRIRYK